MPLLLGAKIVGWYRLKRILYSLAIEISFILKIVTISVLRSINTVGIK